MLALPTNRLTVLVLVALATPAHAQFGFADVTGPVGLDGYLASAGDGHGPGAVFTDLDGDGFPDLYLVRNGPNQLYVNRPAPGGGRTFIRVPVTAGADDPGPATGAIAGDYDNDGDLDLFVVNFDAPNVLLRSEIVPTGALVFTNVTAATDPTPGIADDQHGVGIAYDEGIPLDNTLTAAWADVDRDGDLDLYVGNHDGWNGNPIEREKPGQRDVLYLNLGDGTFVDVTLPLGVSGFATADGAHETDRQWYSSTNAVIFADFDRDGWPDLLVTNKVGGPDDRDMLYRNRGAPLPGAWGGFELVTYDLPLPFGHRSPAAMGVDVADIDHDGDLDIAVTDWTNPDQPDAPGRNDLWRNRLAEDGVLAFVHESILPGQYSWGTQWQDFDGNGWPDLHVATHTGFHDFLYFNYGGAFVELAGPFGVAQQRDSRTCLGADYDGDGWSDLFVVNLDGGPSVLYANRLADVIAPTPRRLKVVLRGDPDGPGPYRSTRDAIGAVVTVVADLDGNGAIGANERQIRDVRSGSSNAASTASLALDFGLGAAAATGGTLTVDWPGGRRSDVFLDDSSVLTLDERTLVRGDLDASGRVDLYDLLRLLSHWGPCPAWPETCPADVSANGIVEIQDLLEVLSHWTG